MSGQPDEVIFGLSEESILKILTKDVPVRSYEGYAEFIHRYLIPNIAELIAANNDAILFCLKDERPT